ATAVLGEAVTSPENGVAISAGMTNSTGCEVAVTPPAGGVTPTARNALQSTGRLALKLESDGRTPPAWWFVLDGGEAEIHR
ncbi:MAG: hypothetical protein AAF488_04510, partial [Planctomycetota bacterium]